MTYSVPLARFDPDSGSLKSVLILIKHMQCENDLATWVLEQREKGVCLDQYEIQKKAIHFGAVG